MEKSSIPMVSCIMPTYNRRAFVPYAIEYFLRQDYPYKELIIIDDGSDKVEDLVPDHPAIRYFRLDKKISLGAKLNLACGYARGSIIAHWDDDDWYASHRLSYQVNSLQKKDIFITGINRLLYFDLHKKDAFKYVYPATQRTWLSGSSLCYKKCYWADNRFADINVGMDGLFVWRTTSDHLCVLPDPTFAVHIIHGQNGSHKDTSGAWWHDYPVAEVEQLMKEDWHTYANGNFYMPGNKAPFQSIKVASAVEKKQKDPSGSSFKNVFACLAHEKKDCIVDLVRNLQYHDPSSIILLYNGSNDPGLLDIDFLTEQHNVYIYPDSKPVKHGYLHSFALECMQFVIDHFFFSTLTIVDSDQLLIRGNYSEYISNFLSKRPGVGLLSSNPQKFGVRDENYFVASEALKEYELWKPLLESFAGGLHKFVYWTFWPSTVFSAKAAEDLVNLFKENELLKNIMQRTRIWGTEEVIFPTLISLLGYEIALNPCSHDYVKYNVSYFVKDIEDAFHKPAVYWVHPVERIFENPLRKLIREKSSNYEKDGAAVTVTKKKELTGQQAILEKIKKIDGWLSEKEADLLIATTLKACIDFPNTNSIVEIGSYHGKTTILFASLLKQFFPAQKIYAIDSHDGRLGSEDKGLDLLPPSFESFKKNIKEAGISEYVEIIKDHSCNVQWQQPISLLFIDGLHDYNNVSGDFRHFEQWIIEEGYVIFHDYADYYPGVQQLVNELLRTGKFIEIQKVESLFVMQKCEPVASPKKNSLQIIKKEEFPKIIHQSWKNEQIPFEIYKEHWVNSWKINHKDWECRLWTDTQNDELVKKYYPEFYEFYLSLNPDIKKADFCRFLYMHHYGGVYADLDFISLKNITPLIKEYDLVLGRLSIENEYYQIPNAFMASRPGNNFWLQVARDAQKAPIEEQSVEKHAGPFRLQWAYDKYQPQNSKVYDHELIYPFDWINFTNWYNGKYYKEEKKRLAEDLQEKSIEEIANIFPEAYCLTFWTHNW